MGVRVCVRPLHARLLPEAIVRHLVALLQEKVRKTRVLCRLEGLEVVAVARLLHSLVQLSALVAAPKVFFAGGDRD
eukprot:3247697-Pleurochrysis_carterae.AAC.1